ncbi:MAG TPA: hypothetical protein VM533_03675 [Fimbriiglobus sp.]|nr:hypothetical protein [Fimbriiglobus sp.]
MTRSMKLAALAGALTILTVGPGCGMFDGYCDDCDTGSHSAEYQRDGLPTPRDVGAQPPSDFTPGASAPMGAGVYPGSAPK